MERQTGGLATVGYTGQLRARHSNARAADMVSAMEDVPKDAAEFERWRAEADRALESARVQAGAGLHNWACFAAEQAAQLATKALPHGLGRGPSGHDLVRLGELAVAAGLELPGEVLDAMRRLGRHYIPARYPDAHPSGTAAAHYGEADSNEAIGDAQRVLEAIDRAWRSL